MYFFKKNKKTSDFEKLKICLIKFRNIELNLRILEKNLWTFETQKCFFF